MTQNQPTSQDRPGTDDPTPGCCALGCLLVLALFLLSTALRSCSGADSSSAPAPPPPSSASVGYEGTTSADSFVCRTRADFDRVTQLSVANDVEGIQQMIARGQVMVVPPGTRVRVLATSFTAREVRILQGDDSGSSGWVIREAIR